MVSENSPDESHRWGGGGAVEEGFNIPVRLGFIVWIPEGLPLERISWIFSCRSIQVGAAS